MKELSLAAQVRTEGGKGPARRTRRDGFIPGVVYGPETKPVSVAVSEREFRATLRGTTGTAIINLNVGGKKSMVVLRDIQRDPVTSHITHVDFHAISMNKPINVNVPVQLVGTPVGVKTDGGIMQVVMRELVISCLPADIPDTVEINVETLGIGDSIHVRNVEIPNAKMITEPTRTIVTIAAPTIIKSETTAAEEAEAVEGAPTEEAAATEADAEKEAEGEKKED